METTAVSLEQAATKFKADIDKFVEAYKAKNRENPERYPLVLGADNSGLWAEFILDFHLTGTV